MMINTFACMFPTTITQREVDRLTAALFNGFKKYKGRIPILHIKDMAEGSEQDFICPGSGIIDFAPIFKEAKKQGIEHYIVERDNEPDGIGCLKSSGEYLRNLGF